MKPQNASNIISTYLGLAERTSKHIHILQKFIGSFLRIKKRMNETTKCIKYHTWIGVSTKSFPTFP